MATEDHAAEAYQVAWEAFCRADLPQLEELTYLSPFPCGLDGWLGNHWLTSAIDTGNADAVAWVLSKGPRVDFIDGGFTALKSALQTEKDWPHSSGRHGRTAEEAADVTIRLIDMLLAAGADINQRMGLDDTALHTAVLWSSPRVLRHLLACGADPFVWNSEYGPSRPIDDAKRAKRYDNWAILRDAMLAARPDDPI